MSGGWEIVDVGAAVDRLVDGLERAGVQVDDSDDDLEVLIVDRREPG